MRNQLTTLVFTIASVCFSLPAVAQYKRIATIAGNGMTGAAVEQGRALDVPISNPFSVEPMADGKIVFTSFDQHCVYVLDRQQGRVRRIAGTGKSGAAGKSGDSALSVEFDQPHEARADAAGNVYVADTHNDRVGMIEAASGRWKQLAGTGVSGFFGDKGKATEATFKDAYSIVLDGDELFVADLQNHRIRKVSLRSGLIDTVAGTGAKQSPKDGARAIEQPLHGPRSLAIDKQNVWIVLREGNSVWRLDRRSGLIHHVAGSGTKGYTGDGGDAKAAQLNGPKGIAVQPGRAIYIADTENHSIRMVTLSDGKITTIAGSPEGQKGFNGDGDNPTARLLSRPHGVCHLPSGELVIGDSENHRVRILSE